MNPKIHTSGKAGVRIAAGAAALGLVLSFGPDARAGAGGRTGQIREEVTVTLKLIQAYVTTKDGKPVTDLTAADFEVTDNGQKMPVTEFENHVVGGADLAPGAPLAGLRTSRKFFFFFDFAFTDARSSRKAREAALHFLDTAIRPADEVGVMSYSPTRGLTIHEYLTTDHAKVRTVVDAFGLRAVVGRAESLTNLIYADELRHMQDGPGVNPATGAYQPPKGPTTSGDAAEDSYFQEQARAQTAGAVDEGRRQGYTDQARQFAQTFTNLSRAMRYVPGWKNIILFSSGISRALIYGERRGMNVPNMDASDPDRMMAELNAYDNAQSNTGVRTEFALALKELKNANSPIYAIDCSPTAGEMDINNPVGTSMSTREFTGKDSLVQLAGESGGKYFSNSMDTKNALAAVEDITSAFYVLGYVVPAAWDGAFHKVKVRILRPGCKVVSQNGYYNPKPFSDYSRFERLLQMTDLALSDNPLARLPEETPMVLTPVFVGGWPHLVAYVRISKDAAAAVIGKTADAYLLVYDEEQGKSAVKSFRLKPPADGPAETVATFAVPTKPGRYTCRIIVQNTVTGLAARGSASVAFTNPAAAPIRLDPPLLLDERAGGVEAGAAPESTLSALFGYDPAKYVPWTGSQPAGPRRVHAAVRCALVAPETELGFEAKDTFGGAATDVPVTVVGVRTARDLRLCLLELAFGGLAPGPHVLKITARDPTGTMQGEATAAFTVK